MDNLFKTITAEDWRIAIKRARATENSILSQIREIIKQKKLKCSTPT